MTDSAPSSLIRTGHFGPYGGRFVPEALVAAIDDLTAAFHETQADPAFRAELQALQRDYTGRPSPLTDVPKFSEHAGGARVILKREDLNHTGSHKINNVLGQALLTRHIGKKRVIAETGAGQHGVATATAAALLGLDCVVYMGEEDTRRQALNVARMRLLGAEVVPVTTGSRTLKDAINEAMRDWVTNVDTTNYVFGTVAGPAPVPVDGARVPAGDRRRGSGADAGAMRTVARRGCRMCRAVGPTRSASSPRSSATPTCGWSASRPAVTASRPGGTPRRSPAERPACCTARARTCCRTRTGRRSSRTPSRPGSTIPVSAPSTRTCTTSDAPSTGRSPTTQAMAAFALLSRSEGIIPAIESAHALAGALDLGRELGPDAIILVNLSGRGDKDVETATRYFGMHLEEELAEPAADAQPRVHRMSAVSDVLAKCKADNRAALIGYLPVGYPSIELSIEAMRAMVEGGCDIIEVGVPVQRSGDGRPHDPGGRRAGGARRASACAMRSARWQAVVDAGAAGSHR